MATVLVADQCEIPGEVATLDAFRRWAQSPEFPTSGRIDWVASCIEVDMSPEDIFTHGTVKSEIVGCLLPLAKARGMHLFTGETRVPANTTTRRCRRRPSRARTSAACAARSIAR